MLAGMYRKGNPSTLLKCKFGGAAVENNMEVPQKIKATMLCSNPASVYMPEESKNTDLKRYAH